MKLAEIGSSPLAPTISLQGLPELPLPEPTLEIQLKGFRGNVIGKPWARNGFLLSAGRLISLPALVASGRRFPCLCRPLLRLCRRAGGGGANLKGRRSPWSKTYMKGRFPAKTCPWRPDPTGHRNRNICAPQDFAGLGFPSSEAWVMLQGCSWLRIRICSKLLDLHPVFCYWNLIRWQASTMCRNILSALASPTPERVMSYAV